MSYSQSKIRYLEDSSVSEDLFGIALCCLSLVKLSMSAAEWTSLVLSFHSAVSTAISNVEYKFKKGSEVIRFSTVPLTAFIHLPLTFLL